MPKLMQYWTTKACSVIAKTHPEALSHYRAIPQSKGQAGRVTKCNYMYGATGQLFVNKLYIQLHVYIRRLSLTHQLGLASFLSTTANLKLNLSCPSAHFPTNIKRHVCHIRWPFFSFDNCTLPLLSVCCLQDFTLVATRFVVQTELSCWKGVCCWQFGLCSTEYCCQQSSR